MTDSSNFNPDLLVQSDKRFLERQTPTPELMQKLGVDENYSQHLRILGTQDGVSLVHYLCSYNNLEKKEINKNLMQKIGDVRGVIVDENNNILCKSMPYTPEMTVEEFCENHDITEASNIFKGVEGTIIRAFYHNNQWMLATYRNVNAYKSSWSNNYSFGELFNLCNNIPLADLDENVGYTFLISHPDSRVVYNIEKPQILLVSEWSQPLSSFIETDNNYTRQEEIQVNSNEELIKLVNENESSTFTGVLVYLDGNYYRLFSERYFYLKNIRGSNPNLYVRYLQLRGTPECDVLKNLYCEESYKAFFNKIETDLYMLSRKLHTEYMNRYIHKNIKQLPKEIFVILQRCHGWHVEDRNNNKITIEKVREFVDSTPYYYVLKMLELTKN